MTEPLEPMQADETTWYARPGYAHADKPEQGFPGMARFVADLLDELDAKAEARQDCQ